MKVSGFTFVRNAIKFDYPIVEAISSILPICDEFVVAVGKSEDGTLELVKSISSDKINIPQVDKFDYSAIDSLKHFKGSHPKVMLDRISKMNWDFSYDFTKKRISYILKISLFIEKNFGWRIGEYKNYKII